MRYQGLHCCLRVWNNLWVEIKLPTVSQQGHGACRTNTCPWCCCLTGNHALHSFVHSTQPNVDYRVSTCINHRNDMHCATTISHDVSKRLPSSLLLKYTNIRPCFWFQCQKQVNMGNRCVPFRFHPIILLPQGVQLAPSNRSRLSRTPLPG